MAKLMRMATSMGLEGGGANEGVCMRGRSRKGTEMGLAGLYSIMGFTTWGSGEKEQKMVKGRRLRLDRMESPRRLRAEFGLMANLSANEFKHLEF